MSITIPMKAHRCGRGHSCSDGNLASRCARLEITKLLTTRIATGIQGGGASGRRAETRSNTTRPIPSQNSTWNTQKLVSRPELTCCAGGGGVAVSSGARDEDGIGGPLRALFD
jgi:hypothetical protein